MHNDLWRNILWRPTDTGGHRPSEVFGETKVHNLDMALAVQEEVLRLEVTVDDVEGVEVGEGGDHLGRVELGCRTTTGQMS